MKTVPPYVLKGHAAKRLTERSILVGEVEAVLRQPTTYEHNPTQRSYMLERTLSRGTLRVWVLPPWPPSGTVHVKTAAWKER